jgi:hypothetical protein
LRKTSYRGLSSAKFGRVPRLLPPLGLEAGSTSTPRARIETFKSDTVLVCAVVL